MKTKYFFTLAIVATMLAACNNDENEVYNGPVEAKITAGVDGPATRAIDQKWSAGNTIGVMVTSSDNSDMENLYKNVEYTVESGGETGAFTAVTGAGIFFQDASETVTFAAYSPYQSSTDAATLPETDGTITVSDTKDQTTTAKQEAFDFLFASGATASKNSPAVEFKENYIFKHKMARLILVLKTSATDGFTADQVKDGTYKLSGLKHSGTFKVTDGTATATGDAVTDWEITNNVKVDDSSDKTRTYTMILLPQTISGSGALTFTATIGEQTYTNSTSINPALAAGTSYTYTITIKKTGLTVSGCTIATWNSGTSGSGDATM